MIEMTEIRQFKTSFARPTEDEILEGIAIARAQHCIVAIRYFVPYHGSCDLFIDSGSTLEGCLAMLSRPYAI